MHNDPFHVGGDAYGILGKALGEFDPKHTIAQVAALLTVPEYHTATLRIEMLLHLACLRCEGRKRPTFKHLARWLHVTLGESYLARLEDPVEDVFITNVTGPGGNYRVFEGIWEQNDYYLQDIIDCVTLGRWKNDETKRILPSIFTLLTLSDLCADRAGLERWDATDARSPREVFLRSPRSLKSLERRVRFQVSDLRAAGVHPEWLAPFVFTPQLRSKLSHESLGNTTLERHPIILFGDEVVLACPTAVSAAIRYFVIEEIGLIGAADALAAMIRTRQRSSLHRAVSQLVDSTAPVGSRPPSPSLPSAPSEEIDPLLCEFDDNRWAHVVLLHDDLQDAVETGIASTTHKVAQIDVDLLEYLTGSANELRSQHFVGMTIVVTGGVGRGLTVTAQDQFPDKWHVAFVSLLDFERFGSTPDTSFLRLWKLLNQLAIAEANGAHIPTMFGILSIYSFWQENNFVLIPSDFPYPCHNGLIYVQPDMVLSTRVEQRRLEDRHAARIDDDRIQVVRRYYQSSHFHDLLSSPIYHADLSADGVLSAVVEGAVLCVWVRASRPADANAAGFVFQVWEALITWLDRLFQEGLEERITGTAAPIQLDITLSDEDQWGEMSAMAGNRPAEPPAVVGADGRCVIVRLPFGFLTTLKQAANHGERALLEAVCTLILRLMPEYGEVSEEDINREVTALVVKAMRGTDARSLHLFEASHPIDRFTPDPRPDPRLVQPEDIAFWQTGLAWKVTETPDSSDRDVMNIAGVADTTRVINRLVDHVWEDIEVALRGINAHSIIVRVMANNEAIVFDRRWWQQTARALVAMRADPTVATAVAGDRESRRAEAITAGRVLVEMALCAADLSGGRDASTEDCDHLVAAVRTLLELASHSDAIHGQLADAELIIQPSGEVWLERNTVRTVIGEYMRERHAADFASAAEEYDRLFVPPSSSELSIGDEAFVKAFAAEYDLAPSLLIDGIAEIMDMVSEAKTTVLATTRLELSERLRRSRHFEDHHIRSFFDGFGLTPRPRWEIAPPGFDDRDWQPWRYRRRLSVTARPLVLLGTGPEAHVIVGITQLGASISAVFDNIKNAWLPGDYVRTDKMRTYLGSRAEKMGHEFTVEVAASLENEGWRTRCELKMSTLGAPPAFGDVDIFAWNDSSSTLFVIECKRLKPANTTGEIVEVLREFRGEQHDRLGRHLRRAEWIRSNLPDVCRFLGNLNGIELAQPVLVTNRDVPMRYVSNLPLTPDHIVPVDGLYEYLVAQA